MRIEFTNLIALALLALIPVALYLARHSLANLSRLRGRVSTGVRVLILLLIILALAGLRVRTTSRDVALIFLVDVSASVAQDSRPAILDFINSEIDRAAPRDFISVVAFGREPSVELAPTRKEALADWRIKEIASDPPRDYTDIAAALRLAAALVPDTAVGRFVLISDGNENLESATEKAQLLGASGIEVYTRTIDTTTERGLTARRNRRARSGNAVSLLSEGEAFDLKVTIDSTRDTDAMLAHLSQRFGRFRARRSLERDRAKTSSCLPQRVEQKGFYTYRAEIEAINADGFVQNNSREAFAHRRRPPEDALPATATRSPRPLLRACLRKGISRQTFDTAAAAPTTLAGFQDYDLVIFDNVPAQSLTNGQMKMVQSYVRDLGGGFIDDRRRSELRPRRLLQDSDRRDVARLARRATEKTFSVACDCARHR